MDVVERLVDRRLDIASYGLALMFVLAGASKFVVLTQWIGYTPGWLVAMAPVGAATLMHVASVIEIGLAVGLVVGWKRHIWAGLGALWLAQITVMTGMMGIYDVAIRDVGLTAYAVVVALMAYPVEGDDADS
jgi:hypothetical protein